jgi:thiosulfate reductase/polysulfide reductase chain A
LKHVVYLAEICKNRVFELPLSLHPEAVSPTGRNAGRRNDQSLERFDMQAHTICLRCHQKCHLAAQVVDGKIVALADASPQNRKAPCSEVCPIGMDVPDYMLAAAQGKFEEAMKIIRDTNPFPLVCGRICHHPCEAECIRGVVDDPLAIQGIKRMVADHARNIGEEPVPTTIRKDKKIAVVGGGPAGLTAAHDLAKAGYEATVYEAGPMAGGMLSRVIPEFKLPQEMVQEDIGCIEALGVGVKTNTPVGDDPTLQQLLDEYDAVLVATGAWEPCMLDIPGKELEGIHVALPLMEQAKQGAELIFSNSVVVIGGGNTAMDAARLALRLGAARVDVACLESRESMPAHPWEIDYAEREGIAIHPGLAPQAFTSRDGKRVGGVTFQRVQSTAVDPLGKITWTLQQGPENEVEKKADAVIVGIGQVPRLDFLAENSGVQVTPCCTLAVDPQTLATGMPGLFAAGDVVIGAGTVVESIAAGRRAASAVIAYLEGTEENVERPALSDALQRARQMVGADFATRRCRLSMPTLPPTEAVRSCDEVELGFDEEDGRTEAGRCLNCSTVCVKGATIPDVMYHPDRLLHPMQRIGARGEGRWQRISWDEALGTIAARLKEIKGKYGPEAIHVSCGSGQKHIGIQATKIAERLWPTPNTHLGRYTCIHPDVMSNSVTFGDTITYEFGPDYSNAKCIIFWGAEPDVATPAQAREVHRALRRGARLMVIDPRPIPMARRADLWLRIRPGTDMALALAMQNVIITEELYDREFVENYCAGFAELREHVQHYTPDWAAGITGLPREQIVQAARMYATVKPGCIYIRLGSGAQQATSTQTCRSISILIGITGNVDVKGGNLLYYRTFRESLFWQTYLMFWGVKPQAAVNEKRIGAAEYPLMHKRAICNVPGTIRAMEEGRVRAMWCVANNLIVAEMDSRRIWEIMKHKLDFVFVSELFMTPTAELADIVLPAAFYPECDLLVAAFGHPSSYVTAARRIVEPLGECKDDREVAIEIAKRMCNDVSPWETVQDYLNWRLKYQGVTYDELCAKPGARLTFPRKYKRYKEGSPAFNTPSGKVELRSSIFAEMGVDPLPVYQEPPESPFSTPKLFVEFPLIYTHYRLHNFMHSEGRQIGRQRRLTPEPYLEISPEAACRFRVVDGDWVRLETPGSAGRDSVKFRARLVPGMHPDVVAGPHAWWFPEEPTPDHGCFESNINTLLTLDPPYDPVVGVPQCRAVLCRIQKI